MTDTLLSCESHMITHNMLHANTFCFTEANFSIKSIKQNASHDFEILFKLYWW